MATWVQPRPASQSSRASRSSVIVLKVRVAFCTRPSSAVVRTQATTNFLWISSPQQHGYMTCMTRTSSTTGGPGARQRGVREQEILSCVLPTGGATNGGAWGHPGPTTVRLAARISTDLWCRRRPASIAIFMTGGGPQAGGNYWRIRPPLCGYQLRHQSGERGATRAGAWLIRQPFAEAQEIERCGGKDVAEVCPRLADVARAAHGAGADPA